VTQLERPFKLRRLIFFFMRRAAAGRRMITCPTQETVS
jgi:hypothetical protein